MSTSKKPTKKASVPLNTKRSKTESYEAQITLNTAGSLALELSHSKTHLTPRKHHSKSTSFYTLPPRKLSLATTEKVRALKTALNDLGVTTHILVDFNNGKTIRY